MDTLHINTFEGDSVFKMTLLEAPTGTLFFYYKDIKQEIVHTLLFEEYGVSKKWVIIMDRKQDLNVTSTQARKSGPSAQDRDCARGFGGGTKKRRANDKDRNKSSICDICVTCVDVRCFE